MPRFEGFETLALAPNDFFNFTSGLMPRFEGFETKGGGRDLSDRPRVRIDAPF